MTHVEAMEDEGGYEMKVAPYANLEKDGIDPVSGDDAVCAACKAGHAGCGECCAICRNPCDNGVDCEKHNVGPGCYYAVYGGPEVDGVDGVDRVDDVDGVDGALVARTPDEIEDPLTEEEADELDGLEAVIGKNIRAFFAVGNALKAIREKRLYRQKYPTFEDYCVAEWDIGRNYANRQIAAAELCEILVPIGTKTSGEENPEDLLPRNESHVRPLLRLEKEDQIAAWQVALEEAKYLNNGRMTAKIVQAAVEKIKPPVVKPKAEPVCSKFMTGQANAWIETIRHEIETGSSNLEGIRVVLNQLRGYIRQIEKVADAGAA